MAWKDNLRPASFRGVPFEVESDDSSFGRRVQVHEYVQRDKPYVEDLGRAAREINITAFLIGADFMDKRDRLLAALETAGPGPLVHPWYPREMTVTVKDPARVSHSNRHGGMCTIALSFVEAGELSFPTAGQSLGSKSLLAADALEEAATTDFTESFSIDGMPAFVADDALNTINNCLSFVERSLGDTGGLLASPLSKVGQSMPGMLGDPSGLAGKVFGLFNRGASVLTSTQGIFGGGGSYALNRDRVSSLVSLSNTYRSQPALVAASPTRKRMASNQAAINALFSRAMLVQAAGMATVMEMPVYDDALQVRKQLSKALDDESFNANDPVYIALQELRSNVHADISDRMAASSRLTTINPVVVTPALVLAYDQYEDVAREPEMVDRNKVVHPGFVPTEPLKVLSA